MAVDKVLCLKELYQDCSQFTMTDESDWLDIAPDRREDSPRYLIGAKMDENQNLTWLDIETSDPETQLEWTIPSGGLGGYRFFYMDVPFWDQLTNYIGQVLDSEGAISVYPHIVTNNDVAYLCTASNTDKEPGVDAGWEDYWTVFDLINLKNHVLNPYLNVLIHDDLSTCEYEDCILDEIEDMTDKELCGACCDTEQFMKLMKMQFMLDAAISANWQEKTPRADLIINQAHKKFCC